MTRTRIYRTSRGWIAEQRDAAGRTRTRYPSGRAVLTALDPRNRWLTRTWIPEALLTRLLIDMARNPVDDREARDVREVMGS